MGNLVTKNQVYRIVLKSHGASTLGGRKVWFDDDIHRLNFDEHGRYLGEFGGEDRVLVILNNGDFYTTDFDVNNHYETDLNYIGKYNADTVWSAILQDADNNNYPYLKRFQLENSNKHHSILGENADSRLILLTHEVYPRIRVAYQPETHQEPEEIEVADFVGVKGYKAKGKRLTTLATAQIEEIEPLRKPEPEEEEVTNDNMDDNDDEDGNIDDPDANKTEDEIRDEITGQLSLF